MPASTRVLLAAAALVAAAAVACDHSPADTSPEAELPRAVQTISADDVRVHVEFLASDALRGRRTGAPGLTLAADYILAAFRAVGLESFLQRFPCTGVAESAWPANIVALLPGSDPVRRREWVVVTAHYDHMGVGLPDARGDSINNGADDNASGTAAVLALARAFARLGTRPARSIAFVAVSGEEQGFVGSAYFVAHRPAPIEEMVANINLDMLGRNPPGLLFLVGDTLSTLGAAAVAQLDQHRELGFVASGLSAADGTFFHSDQLAFAVGGVPGLMLHTGSHADLHRPSDEAALLDMDKVSRAARLTFYLIYAVAAAPTRPTWTVAGERILPYLKLPGGTCSAAP